MNYFILGVDRAETDPRARVRKARAVRYALQEYMCERDFYYLRRGDKPIYPEMQRRIAADLAKAGAPAPIEFDRYEWRYDWR